MDATYVPLSLVLAAVAFVIAFIVYSVRHPPKPIHERVRHWAQSRGLEVVSFEVNPANRPLRLWFNLLSRYSSGTLCRIVVRDSEREIRGAWVRFYSVAWGGDREEVWWMTSPVNTHHENPGGEAR